MDKIEKLIKELCPNGVERHKLGDICDTVTDFTAAGSFASNAKNVKYKSEPDFAQLVRTTDLKSKFSNTKFVYVDEHAFNYLYRVNINEESIILPNVGNCGEVYYVMPKDLPYAKNVLGPNALLVRSSTQNNRFLYHLFQERDFQRELGNITSNTGQSKFNKTNLKKIVIPIPPLKIQEEIVKILDKFTDYVTELTTELTLRQKQYHYYRNKLLSFDNQFYKVEWKTLESISISISTGVTPKKSNHEYYVGGTIPWLRTNEVRNNEITKTDMFVTEKALKETSIKWISKNSVIVAISGATAGRVGINKIPLTTNQHCCCLTIDSSLANYKYVFYWLLNKNEDILELKQGARGDLNMGIIKKLSIPIPSLEIQSRIVQVLDNFDAVCNDLNIGLPKEIELRQKQYEFFRDKLLTFAAEGVYTDSTVQTRHN